MCFLFLISLVSYQNNLIYFQGHCGFNIWYLLISLPCFKRKGRILRFPVVNRSLLGIGSLISFLRIPYSLKFCTVFHFYLLYFRVIRLLYVCTSKLFLNPLIPLFVFYSDVALSIPHFLVSYQHNLISCQRYCVLRVNFLILVFTFDLYSFRYFL